MKERCNVNIGIRKLLAVHIVFSRIVVTSLAGLAPPPPSCESDNSLGRQSELVQFNGPARLTALTGPS
jgi:hypothetical protein